MKRYWLTALSWTLIWSGVLLLGYFAWHLWATDRLNAEIQTDAAAELDKTFEEVRQDSETPEPERIDTGESVIEYYPEDAVAAGEPFGFLTIAKIDLEDVAIFEGVDRETLKSGPGHLRSTPVPGQPGNAVMSGHRTTYGRPFWDFDQLEVGDEIQVETTVGTHLYLVREVAVVAPTDLWVADAREGGWLTLTTCEPRFSASQRLVVFAEMVDGPNLEFIELSRDGGLAS